MQTGSAAKVRHSRRHWGRFRKDCQGVSERVWSVGLYCYMRPEGTWQQLRNSDIILHDFVQFLSQSDAPPAPRRGLGNRSKSL